jgi:hypothetical protein
LSLCIKHILPIIPALFQTAGFTRSVLPFRSPDKAKAARPEADPPDYRARATEGGSRFSVQSHRFSALTTGPPDVRGPEYFRPSNRTKTPLQPREASEFEERLARLEEKAMMERHNAARRLKQVILWDDGRGSAQIEAAAIEREHGGKVEVVLVRWRTDAG